MKRKGLLWLTVLALSAQDHLALRVGTVVRQESMTERAAEGAAGFVGRVLPPRTPQGQEAVSQADLS